MSLSVIAVIPARGGSKQLPGKNLANLGGKPLIAWTIKAALKCSLVTRTVVSTDDYAIADCAKHYGADVPFIRPKELSHDTASTEDVLLHAVTWIEEHEKLRYDALLFLQATDPFRRNNIVYNVIKTLADNPDVTTVFAAKPEHKNYWINDGGNIKPLSFRGHAPRQQKQLIFREDTGVACATRMDIIRAGRRIGDKVIIIPHSSPGDFIDIHSEYDLFISNLIVTNRGELPNEE